MSRINLLIVVLIFIIAFAFVSDSLKTDSEEKVLISEPWDHSPITVYIDDRDVPEHYSPSYRTGVENALDFWEKGGNGRLSYEPEFQIVDVDDADIMIMWVENLENDAGVEDGVAGFARPYIVNGRFERVEIVLETGNYEGYAWRQYGDISMEDIAAHEIGHALGLGHVNDRNDIMYPKYDRKQEVDPLLFQATWPLLLLIALVVFLIISYHGSGWLRYKKKRESLEDEVFKDEDRER